MLKYHLDEHLPLAVAVGLRRHGIDVTTSAEVDLLGSDDAAHLAYSIAEQRVIVTHDHDFLRLHAAGAEHSGIAYCHQDKYSIGELLPLLLLMNTCYSAEEMAGRVEFL